jgi:hypothetical protein
MGEKSNQVTEPQNTEEPVTETKEPDTKEVKPAVNVNNVDLEALKKEIADAVAKREKDKLYPTIEKYKADLKEAQDKLKEYEDKNLSAEERTTKQLEEANAAIAELTKKMEAVAEAASKEVYAVKLEAQREKMLMQYKDEIIPELIMGSTIDEIAESAEKAHRKYIEIRDREVARIKEETKAARQTTKTSTGIAPTSSSDEVLMSRSCFDKAKPEEWEALKAKLLAIAQKS